MLITDIAGGKKDPVANQGRKPLADWIVARKNEYILNKVIIDRVFPDVLKVEDSLFVDHSFDPTAFERFIHELEVSARQALAVLKKLNLDKLPDEYKVIDRRIRESLLVQSPEQKRRRFRLFGRDEGFWRWQSAVDA